MTSYPHISMHFNGNAHCGKRQKRTLCNVDHLTVPGQDSKVLQTYVICSQSYITGTYVHVVYLYMLCCCYTS